MKASVVGSFVGLLNGVVRVKSPAPPLIALVGLLGMVLGEEPYQWVKSLILKSVEGELSMSDRGIVSARHVDHVGMTVPDLNAAISFFENALDAQLLWRVGPFDETPTGVPIKSVHLAMLRLGPT